MSEGKKLVAFPGRKPIPKSIRFEVFKRDAFTCQYCGAKAPEVILNVDHIKPVADGGENEIVNLITSCFACNSGKGARKLDDDAILQKQRAQLDELNERRNQLEMMVAWRESLANMSESYVNEIQTEMIGLSGYGANETGIKHIEDWLRRYSFMELIAAVKTSFGQYLRMGPDGKYTDDSWGKAFDMVPKIAKVNKSGGMPEEKKRIFYVRAILRNRLKYVDERNVVSLIQQAVDCGADIERIVDLSKTCRNWRDFSDVLYDHIAKADDE